MIRTVLTVTVAIITLTFASPALAQAEFGDPQAHTEEHNSFDVQAVSEPVPVPEPELSVVVEPTSAPEPELPVIVEEEAAITPCSGQVTYVEDSGASVSLEGDDCIQNEPGDWFLNEVGTFAWWSHDSDWLHNPFPTHDGDFDLVWFDALGEEIDRVPAEIS